MDPAELERLATRALRGLPRPHAPHTLFGRVMSAVALEAYGPWYRRAWRAWPLGWQAASAAVVALLVTAGVVLIPGAAAGLAEVWSTVSVPSVPLPSEVAGPVRTLTAVWDAMATVWRLVVAPVAPYVALFVLLMSLACVAFGTALDRVVALGGAVKS